MNALLQAWEKTLRRSAGARAVVIAESGEAVTFAELDRRAEAWRAAHAPGPEAMAGRTAVFAVPNGIRWLEIFLGLLRAGAIAVPLDPGEPRAAQIAVAEDLRAGFLWDDDSLVARPGARRIHERAICLCKITSGTTGRPRPLAFTAAQLLADGRQVTATMGITGRDSNYALIPFGHSYGLGNLVLPLLAQGIPVIVGSAALPQAIAGDFFRWGPTVFPSVPAIWRALAASDIALPGLRLAISAGAPLPPETARDFAARFGRKIHAFYGSSETGGIAFDRSGNATLAGGVGRALRGVTLAPGRGGRLCVSSAAVLTHRNRRRRGRHGAWLVADRVAIDARGNVTLLGRRGTTVKISGRRIDLNEVAARLRRLEGVNDVWIGASEAGEPVLGAALVSSREAIALRQVLQADTAAWKIPKRLVTLSAFPLTGRGKVNTAALREIVFGKTESNR